MYTFITENNIENRQSTKSSSADTGWIEIAVILMSDFF